MGGQLLAKEGVEPHAGRHRRRDMTNRLERGDGQQEVGVRQRGVCRPVKVHAPPGRVAVVEAELVGGRVEQLPERDHALWIGALRQT
jgi:hypothetical protein